VFGWTGKALIVDLQQGKWVSESIPEGFYHRWLGGKGINAAFQAGLLPGWESLAGEAASLAVGPLVGSPIMGANVWCLDGPHPMTGSLISAYGTGNLGIALKFAGWDQVILHKTASTPRYIYIREHGCDIRDYPQEMPVSNFVRQVRREWGEKIAVLYTAETGASTCRGLISSSTDAALLLKEHNLKAIVVEGSGCISLANPELVLNHARSLAKIWKESRLPGGRQGCAVCHGKCDRLAPDAPWHEVLDLWLAAGICPQWPATGLGHSMLEIGELMRWVTGWSYLPDEQWSIMQRIEAAWQSMQETARGLARG
jgi:aldehyde:ferredoxin oxidoreductase